MDRYDVSAERLMDPQSRRHTIKRLRKVTKWSWIAAVATLFGAVAALVHGPSAVCGFLMGASAMNLVVGVTNGIYLTLALYIEKTETLKASEPAPGLVPSKAASGGGL